MKKFTIVGLTLILLLVITACSANNNVEENQATENEAVEAPIVEEDEHTEEPAVEPANETKPAIEPEVEPVIEAEVVEAEKIESKKVEKVEQPAVIEPVPVVVMPKIHKVEIVNFAFSPASMEISVGDIVEFTNSDGVKHSAVADNGVFDTGLLAKDKSKQITFSEAGEFGYYCGPHPDMKAVIIVK